MTPTQFDTLWAINVGGCVVALIFVSLFLFSVAGSLGRIAEFADTLRKELHRLHYVTYLDSLPLLREISNNLKELKKDAPKP